MYLKTIYISVANTSLIVGYEIDSTILVELIKAHNVDMIYTLYVIPFMHSEYVSLMLENNRESDV